MFVDCGFPGARITTPTILVRFAFLPLFLVCNIRPGNNVTPVVMESDVAYIVIMALFRCTCTCTCTCHE